MLKKFLLGLGALFFILMGSLILIMGYVFNNPESVFTAFHSVTEKLLQGQKYEEKAEFFLQGMDELVVHSNRVDIRLHTSSENTLKILMQGKVPRFESGPFVLQRAGKKDLQVELQEPLASNWITMNVNGHETTQETDSQLSADIYLPRSFKGRVSIETRRGNVELALPQDSLYELDLQSVSGKISNDLQQKPTSGIEPQKVGHIKVQTENGSISVKPQE